MHYQTGSWNKALQMFRINYPNMAAISQVLILVKIHLLNLKI